MLEAADNVGGAAVTEEFHPGFRNSAASYTVSLLKPKVIRDMGLSGTASRSCCARLDNFLPGDGDYLLAGPQRADPQEIARHVQADGAAMTLQRELRRSSRCSRNGSCARRRKPARGSRTPAAAQARQAT